MIGVLQRADYVEPCLPAAGARSSVIPLLAARRSARLGRLFGSGAVILALVELIEKPAANLTSVHPIPGVSRP
jgi:hypothetical protein